MAKPQLGFVGIDVVAQKFSEDLRLPESVPFAKKVIGPFFGGEISQNEHARRISSANTARVKSWKATAFAKTVREPDPFGELMAGPVCAGFWMMSSKSFLPKRFKIGILYMNAVIVGA